MTMERSANLGDIVVSTQGRDVGRVYLVVGAEGELLLLCDGKYRRQANPKKKKRKHIRLLSAAPELKEKLGEGRRLTDSEIHSALKKYKVRKEKAEE